ncbi:MAG: hypothetical protein GF368_02580 [Candidatus Aenigmarchaeota archaeon]|nr:hypothetical protein [Candidatus Aenigmarchaeota archaeon]
MCFDHFSEEDGILLLRRAESERPNSGKLEAPGGRVDKLDMAQAELVQDTYNLDPLFFGPEIAVLREAEEELRVHPNYSPLFLVIGPQFDPRALSFGSEGEHYLLHSRLGALVSPRFTFGSGLEIGSIYDRGFGIHQMDSMAGNRLGILKLKEGGPESVSPDILMPGEVTKHTSAYFHGPGSIYDSYEDGKLAPSLYHWIRGLGESTNSEGVRHELGRLRGELDLYLESAGTFFVYQTLRDPIGDFLDLMEID